MTSTFRAGGSRDVVYKQIFPLVVAAVEILIKFNASIEMAKESTYEPKQFDEGFNLREIQNAIQEGRKKRNEVISEWKEKKQGQQTEVACAQLIQILLKLFLSELN